MFATPHNESAVAVLAALGQELDLRRFLVQFVELQQQSGLLFEQLIVGSFHLLKLLNRSAGAEDLLALHIRGEDEERRGGDGEVDRKCFHGWLLRLSASTTSEDPGDADFFRHCGDLRVDLGLILSDDRLLGAQLREELLQGGVFRAGLADGFAREEHGAAKRGNAEKS